MGQEFYEKHMPELISTIKDLTIVLKENNKNKQMLKINKALTDFRDAAKNLNEIWSKDYGDGDFLTDKYPFSKDFNELCHDISFWVERWTGDEK